VSRVPLPDLDAESQAELAALKRALRLADGFALYVARANTLVLRRQIIADLRANLPRPLVELTLSWGEPPEMPYEQIARVAERAPAGAVISVDGLDVLAPSRDPDWFLRQLNWRRAAYRRLARPLLLWVPEYLLRLMMQHAPDFFDWHSGFYEFTTPETALGETVRQAYAVGDVEQSDLSLAQKRERIALLRGLLDEYVGADPQIRSARASLLGKLGILHHTLGEIPQAIEYYKDVLAIAREIGDRRAEGAGLGNLGLAYSDRGEVAQAIDYYQQALEIAREIGDRGYEETGLGNLGNAYSALGETSRAIDYYQQALEIDQEIGDRRGEGADLGNLGSVYRDLGEVARAIDYYQQALEIAREIGDRRGEENALGNLGSAYSDLGEVARAIDYYQQALEIAREIGDRPNEGIWAWNLGLLHEDADPARAAGLMQICVDYEREIGHPDAEADAARVGEIRARIRAARGQD